MPTQYRMKIGRVGELAVQKALVTRGWEAIDLNDRKRNFPNSDIETRKGNVTRFIQVKVCSVYKWISAGGVNPQVCAGGPIFNRVAGYPAADFIICLTPSEAVAKGTQPVSWRHFVLPAHVAERAFRVNIDAYFNGVKQDGSPRSKKGACQDFVGPGAYVQGLVPDHHDDYAPYEDRYDLLDGKN